MRISSKETDENAESLYGDRDRGILRLWRATETQEEHASCTETETERQPETEALFGGIVLDAVQPRRQKQR